ncbi:MAG: hypothetical protein CL685_00520 [Candidatus Magasanikbacteria bacterium]|nr:hypothetical protein [Candidatus Magasanikbacteria bacterium]
MKKNTTYLFILLALLLSFFVANSVFAQLNIGQDLGASIARKSGFDVTGTDETRVATNIGRVINLALQFIGTLFFALMFYAGFLYLTARGEDEKVTKSITTIRMAIIGIVITTGAYTITNFVVPQFVKRATGEGKSSAQDPIIGCCLLEKFDPKAVIDTTSVYKTIPYVKESNCESYWGGCASKTKQDNPDALDCEYVTIRESQCLNFQRLNKASETKGTGGLL